MRAPGPSMPMYATGESSSERTYSLSRRKLWVITTAKVRSSIGAVFAVCSGASTWTKPVASGVALGREERRTIVHDDRAPAQAGRGSGERDRVVAGTADEQRAAAVRAPRRTLGRRGTKVRTSERSVPSWARADVDRFGVDVGRAQGPLGFGLGVGPNDDPCPGTHVLIVGLQDRHDADRLFFLEGGPKGAGDLRPPAPPVR